jgi:ATP-dependent Clp protease ATP-binding subunit ClpA
MVQRQQLKKLQPMTTMLTYLVQKKRMRIQSASRLKDSLHTLPKKKKVIFFINLMLTVNIDLNWW